ncbi:MAG TPA: hypothetical protein VHX39_19420, partial [Acetobacteraceae bacterium]|nr:hypothetical protein [Acetobacteraceae bacterium]
MSKRDPLTYRDVLQWRAQACAEAGFTIQAVVWTMAADMCRAAWWTDLYGAIEAERRVQCHCRAAGPGDP